ncbi:SusD/RagB family nutrient-binding outer membrane lipoprotein [Dyadobacter subterraneus]|uniref:SusD/RagB family nutrient-binding outer membrane lipoprotein n=1 Tax=Dyadobacter subterraneus TaxID=2773304 RepID=A0ABR9WM03_9BACT|nr:SusD/RagB family nutrient-binding outer membrane lipoprotein [Dyadobacter subterraneus]MBE9466104.1 SusD/RagB family nutrient-binding outer membrane lipoprotein [Dyadobacter subterraneus]
MKRIYIALICLVALAACTDNFVETNENPNQISDETLKQDFNLVGSPFSNLIFNLNGHQIEEDLCSDNWMGFMGTPTDFVGNVNNTTYYIRWNTYWDRIYGSIMSPSKQVIQLAADNNLPLFATWAKLIRVFGMSKLTGVHGPVIYSQYGSTANSVGYDKESDLYALFFKQLDSIQTDLNANKDYTGFKKFDPTLYAGSIPQWQKVVNSLRLRLAVRLSKVDPATAKTQGEKALADPAGLITANSDNFVNSLNGNKIPVAQISYEWDDTRMGAVMESFMVGLKDGRISKYFAPVADASLYTDHPAYPYKGIRNGAYIKAKADHVPFSKVSEDFQTVQTRRDFTAAEVAFLKAEAALRGWAGAGDAKTNYETGIKLSFADWGAGGVDAYIADATSKPINYIDPVDARNSFTASSTITVAWNEADSKELKLEKIITQKYLNTFTNTQEAWVDFRRTGYPKIPSVAKNDSNADWGVIPSGQWIKRMPFVNAERTGNTAAVTAAVAKMGTGAKDDIATRLWWDTGTASNF